MTQQVGRLPLICNGWSTATPILSFRIIRSGLWFKMRAANSPWVKDSLDGFGQCGVMTGEPTTSGEPKTVPYIRYLRAAVLVLLLLAGCQNTRPTFLTRVHEDCLSGDRWACDLLKSLARAKQQHDSDVPTSAEDDVNAIQKGIDRARSVPHIRLPYIPPLVENLPKAGTFPTSARLSW